MQNDPILEAAQRELADLDARRDKVAAFIREHQEYAKKVARSGASTVDVARKGAPASQSEAKKSATSDEVMSVVHDILAVRDDALTLSAIFDQLQVRGVHIGGNNPKQNLSQKLSAHSGFKSYGKRGWFFADQLPQSLRPIYPRLSEIDDPDEEGPDSGAARPLHSNGAIGWSPMST